MENLKENYVGISTLVQIDLGKIPTDALIEELLNRNTEYGVRPVDKLAYEYFCRRLNPRKILEEATPE